MSSIHIDAIEVGMKLSEDAIDNQGRVLLRAGIELNLKHIRMLKTWGINSVSVLCEDDTVCQAHEYPETWLHEAEQLAQAHFQTANQDFVVIQKLQSLWVERFLADKAARVS